MRYTLIEIQPGIYQTPGEWQWHMDADIENEDGDVIRIRVYGDIDTVRRDLDAVLAKLTSEGER